MAFCGIWIDDQCFELLAGKASFGGSRPLDEAAVTALKDFARRYQRIHQRYDAAAALALGRDLFRWLDGDGSALRQLRDNAPRPFVFEVRGPRSPSGEEWALLRAPFELLANEQSFLAEDAPLQFSPVRRLGSATKAPPLSDHRLGLAFMASSPRGQRELDYEAEESAILAAVTSKGIDLVVEESGNLEELGARLADLEQMQALHLSCHGLNRWRPPDDPHAVPRPVLMMETAEGDEQPTEAADLIDALSAGRPRLVFLSDPRRHALRPVHRLVSGHTRQPCSARPTPCRSLSNHRGRECHCWHPPAQIRACPIRALGSYLGCLTAKRWFGQG
jgi:hypothetical protein